MHDSIRHGKQPELQHNCIGCTWRNRDFFCNVGDHDLGLLNTLTITRSLTRDKVLFVEGQHAAGVYILCHGRVKLSTCSPAGKVIIHAIAQAGEVLGLSAVVAGVEYESTATALEPCQVNFIPDQDFLLYLRRAHDAGFSAAVQLARRTLASHKILCSFGLSDPVRVKLAKLFLNWCAADPRNSQQLTSVFTHEEIAGMIGSTRETVTRALRDMRESGLVTLKGSDLTIHDADRLRQTAGLRPVARYAA